MNPWLSCMHRKGQGAVKEEMKGGDLYLYPRRKKGDIPHVQSSDSQAVTRRS